MAKTAERISQSDEADNPVFQRHIIAYEAAREYVSGDVLEVGCGEGYGVSMLSARAERYTAVDKYRSEVFAQYSGHNTITCRQMNVPPFEGIQDNTFDTVVSFQVIEHIKEDVAFLKEIRRVLKPGGCAVLTTPNKSMSLTRNPWHIREYNLEEMHALVGKIFDNYSLKGVFGNEKVMKYYEQNRASVSKITRFDILNLQYRLPRSLLKIPYDLLNRVNRKKLKAGDRKLVAEIKSEDYYIADANTNCLDFFIILKKK